MNVKRALLALSLGATSAVTAADWRTVAQTDADGSYVAIDYASKAQTSSNIHKAWFKWTHKKMQRIPDGIPKPDPGTLFYTEKLQLSYFNCKERTMAMLQLIYRDANGNVVASDSVDLVHSSWAEVAPETVGEAMLEESCLKQ